jgi:hypothetical protein
VARLPSDPEMRAFHLAIKAEVKRIGDLARGRGYVTYTIRDPRLSDRFNHPDGPRIYVGESKQMWIRANDHLTEGGRATTGSEDKCKATRIYAILKDRVVPKFEILGDAPTKLASLISETLWARRSVYQGYQLANGWPEHQSKEAPNGIHSVPRERYLEFTVAEAHEDGVRVEVRCASCGYAEALDLAKELLPFSPTKKLSTIRKQIRCTRCDNEIINVLPPLVWPKG